MPRSRVTIRWIVLARGLRRGLGGCGPGPCMVEQEQSPTSLLEQSRAAYPKRTGRRRGPRHSRSSRQPPPIQSRLRLLGRVSTAWGAIKTLRRYSSGLHPSRWRLRTTWCRGQASIRSQNVKLAVENLQKALQLDPDHFESRVTLEQVFFRQDRLVEADRETERLLALPGREAVGELMRGQIRFQQSDRAAAALHFERALRHPEQWDFIGDPNFFRKQLARSLLGIGQPPGSRFVAELTDDPQDPKTSWLLSRCDLQEAFPIEAAVSAAARLYRQSKPMEPEPAPFVGEVQCSRCHAGIVRDHNKSRHARTYFRKDQLPAIEFPLQPIADPCNAQVSHAFHKRADSLDVETRWWTGLPDDRRLCLRLGQPGRDPDRPRSSRRVCRVPALVLSGSCGLECNAGPNPGAEPDPGTLPGQAINIDEFAAALSATTPVRMRS